MLFCGRDYVKEKYCYIDTNNNRYNPSCLLQNLEKSGTLSNMKYISLKGHEK